MAMGKIKHVFPGGNTPQGFFSYYSYIIEPTETRLFVLKGGPGVGKSTFMKKIGNDLLNRGYDIEFHHCSSDNESLDGVKIPALKVALIDGTAPHVVDPKYPGCFDEILNLGEYWQEERLIARKDDIIAVSTEISQLFQRAYRLLRAARAIYDDWEEISSRALNFSQANRIAQELILTIFAGVTSVGNGKLRKLFASAITPNGLVHFLDSLLVTVGKCYVITGDPGTGRSTLLQKVIDCALAKGLDVEAYYCPLDPVKPEHVIIPALDIALTTSAPPHLYPAAKAHRLVDMNNALHLPLSAADAAASKFNQETFWILLERAVDTIAGAKKLHDGLEKFYVPNINFDGVQKLCDQTLNRILCYK